MAFAATLVPNGSQQTDNAAPQTRQVKLTDQQFVDQTKKGYVFVDFWAEWCHPCLMVAPVLEKLAEKWEGKVTFGKLNVDENPLTQSKFGIMSIPTFILFNNGEPIAQTMGAAPESFFEQFLNANYKEDETPAEELPKAA